MNYSYLKIPSSYSKIFELSANTNLYKKDLCKKSHAIPEVLRPRQRRAATSKPFTGRIQGKAAVPSLAWRP